MLAFLCAILLLPSFFSLSQTFSYQNPVFTPTLKSAIVPSILYDNVNNNNSRYLLSLSMVGQSSQAVQIFHSITPTDWILAGWAVNRLPMHWQLDSKSSEVVRLLRTSYRGYALLLLVFSGIHQGRGCIGYGFTKNQDYTSFSINEVPIYCTETDSDLSPSLYQENLESSAMLVWSERDRYGVAHVFNGYLSITRTALKLKFGTKSTLLGADGSWEQDRIHSPQLFRYNNLYYLFYTGGSGNSSAIGVARADSISGPYEKFSRNPVITSDVSTSGWRGPSYPSVVDLSNGLVTMFYQAVRSQTNRSSLLLDQLKYTDKWFELAEVCGIKSHRWYPSTCYHSIP